MGAEALAVLENTFLRYFIRALTSATFAFALTGGAALASVSGTVVTAKSGEHALILWDATPAVVTIVDNKQPRDAAMESLESQAMQIAGERAPALTDAKTITVRVVYQKIGAVNPAYGTPTFAGVERVLDLTVDAPTAKTQSGALAKSLASGTTPKGVTLQVTGVLPPL